MYKNYLPDPINKNNQSKLTEKQKINDHLRNINYTEEADNIYLNSEIVNKGDLQITSPNSDTEFILAEFNETFDETILEKANDFYLSVIRFYLPAFSIPLWIFPVELGQSNINTGALSITLDHDGDVVTQNLTFTPRTIAPAPSITGNIQSQPSGRYYFIFDYQHIVDIVNQAFLDAYNNLSSPPVGSFAPFMVYNTANKTFSIITQIAFYDLNTTAPNALIKVYWNFKFQKTFNGMTTQQVNLDGVFGSRAYQLLSTNEFDNLYKIPNLEPPATTNIWYEFEQDFSTIETFNPVKDITFESNLLKVRGELTQSDGSFRKTLTDFQPITQSDGEVRTNFNYFPQGPYRLLDIIDNGKIRKVDFKVYWNSLYGNTYPFLIPPYDFINLKLLFARKSIYKNYNPVYN